MPLEVVKNTDEETKHQLDINALVFHNEKLYSAADDGKIKLWDENLKLVAEVQAHPCSVFSIAAGDDVLYSCSNDGSVKSWSLDDLKEKQMILQEGNEMWKVYFNEGKLYVGDDAGLVRIFDKRKMVGVLEIMEPIKDLIATNNIVYTVRDLYVIISEINPSKKTITALNAIEGRAPFCTFADKLCFSSRSGRDLLVHHNSKQSDFNQTAYIENAHDLIINALCGTSLNEEVHLYSGGWDRVLKKWRIDQLPVEMVDSCSVGFCITAMITNASGNAIYVGGENGVILKMEAGA